MSETSKTLEFDPRLDGLRALAVTFVLVFHFDKTVLPGGYLGVDLFFVLSGYLIARQLGSATLWTTGGIPAFYIRRYRRIVPSLVVVALTIAVLAPFVLLPHELQRLGEALFATGLMVPNLYFWNSFDYFSTFAQESPLLHFWSLGVEAQFYLLAPALFWAGRRMGLTWWRIGLVAAVALSCALSVYAAQHHPKAGFFWLPTRFWQFGLGMLVGVFGLRGPTGLGWLGLAMILGFVLVGGGVPVTSMIMVTVGAALVLAGPQRGGAAGVLSHPAVRMVGTHAYTLYLWHWPLIVFAKLRWGALDAVQLAMLAALCAVLAAATTRWVERPFRHHRAIGGPNTAALACLTIAAAFRIPSLSPLLYNDKVRTLSAYAQYRDRAEFTDQTRLHQCFVIDSTPNGAQAFDRSACLPKPDGRLRVLLIGDSHAAHLSSAVRSQRDWQVAQATMAGCRPFLRAKPGSGCEVLVNQTLRELRFDLVVFSARWQADEMLQLLATLPQISGRVVVLGPMPEYPGGLPQRLARDAWTGQDTVAGHLDPATKALDRQMKTALAGAPVTYVSMFDILCPGDACLTFVGEVPMQFDYGHFTAEGAAFAMPRILDAALPTATLSVLRHDAK